LGKVVAKRRIEEVKGEFIRKQGWYVPTLHEKYLKGIQN